MNVIAGIPSGPVPNDDFLLVQIIDPASGAILCYGSEYCFGSLFAQVVLGFDRRYFFDQQLFTGLADAATVTLAYQWNHHSGSTVDTATVTGCRWDASSGLFNLIGRMQTHPMDGSALAQILAAVRPTYHNA
jgi:hypothetical protein